MKTWDNFGFATLLRFGIEVNVKEKTYKADNFPLTKL